MLGEAKEPLASSLICDSERWVLLGSSLGYQKWAGGALTEICGDVSLEHCILYSFLSHSHTVA